MKRILALPILLITMTTISCGGDSNMQASSSNAADTAAVLNKDSIDRAAKFKSTSQVAYGKVKFGISKKEYEKVMPEMTQKIGEYDYTFLPQYDHNGKLFGIWIQSYKETANYIDTKLSDQVKNLHDVIAEKYEKETYDFDKADFFKFKPGYTQWQYLWELGTKNIRVGMTEEDGGSEYRAVCYIYDTPLLDAFDDYNAQKSKEKQKSASNNF